MLSRRFTTLLLLAACLFASRLSAAPLATGFSYQGLLRTHGEPASGLHDFTFWLYRDAVGGTATTPPLQLTNVPVSNGVFTVTLDFGQNTFVGEAAWLEVAVRNTSSTAEFTALSPRQPLAPSPYSLFTLRAATLTMPLTADLLPTNIARLDTNQVFQRDVQVRGTLSAQSITGDGSALSNVVAAYLSAKAMQRLWRVNIPFVAVTNAGNAPDVNGKGAVPYDFRIGKYEINNRQYTAFLNAVAADDPKSLYNTNSATELHAGILRTGAPGEYHYEIKPGMGHQPVVLVDFYDALRFCNWLHNGQPTGAQDATTTEDGAYTLTPAALAAENVLRNLGARFWLPSDDEWYKAAYHQPLEMGGDFGDYWKYPTRNFDAPISEPPPGGANSANSCCDAGRRATDVGAYPLASSHYGTFDQAGNVQEWTEFTPEFTPLRNRRIRGGSWDYNEFYSGKDDFEFDTTDYDSNSIGFRVAGHADPF